MGQAKRRREEIAGYAPGRCNGCNLCCVVLEIPELSKPAFVPCANLCSAGCSIHRNGQPEGCVRFECNYILAHRLNLAQKSVLPHPKEAGAFIGHVNGSGTATLYVDPKNPRKWQSTTMPTYLKALVAAGITVAIFDRGFRVETRTAAGIDDLASIDLAAYAAANGVKPDVECPAG